MIVRIVLPCVILALWISGSEGLLECWRCEAYNADLTCQQFKAEQCQAPEHGCLWFYSRNEGPKGKEAQGAAVTYTETRGCAPKPAVVTEIKDQPNQQCTGPNLAAPSGYRYTCFCSAQNYCNDAPQLQQLQQHHNQKPV